MLARRKAFKNQPFGNGSGHAERSRQRMLWAKTRLDEHGVASICFPLLGERKPRSRVSPLSQMRIQGKTAPQAPSPSWMPCRRGGFPRRLGWTWREWFIERPSILSWNGCCSAGVVRGYPQAADVKYVKRILEVKQLACWEAIGPATKSGAACA